MKDWRRSPEPAGMMGLKDASYAVVGNWGQPEELHSTDFDPASPLPHTTPTVFFSTPSSRQPHPSAHRATGVSSLYSMCLRVILRNISSVQDLGVLPYHHAKPILEECRIDQLILLEENSPHLLEHSEEIWKRNCLRDFIDLRKKYNSDADNVKEPKSWRRLYFRTKGEIEQAKTDAAKRIKDKYEQHRAEKEAKKLVVRDRPMMAKTARSGGRKFGMAVAGGGGVSKGQSLLNKARSGSAAQAKLTATRSARSSFRAQGRSKAVGAEIAPEAAGVEMRQLVRPMVAPRKVLGGASEGLTKMREFSRSAAGSDGSNERETSTARGRSGMKPSQQGPSVDGSTSAKQHADVAPEHTIPRMRPHEVAAAPPLTPTLPSTSTRVSDRSTAAEMSNRKPPPAVPPPDIARAERRKIDFFGTTAKSSPAGTSSSNSPRASSGNATTVEVRGVKRAHSNNMNPVASPPASSPTGGTSFFPPRAGNAGGSGVRVVHAKRARTNEPSKDAGASPRSTPPLASPSGLEAPANNARYSANPTAAPPRSSPIRQQSSNSSVSRPPIKDPHLARASPAALSSIFVRPSSHRTGSGTNGGKR